MESCKDDLEAQVCPDWLRDARCRVRGLAKLNQGWDSYEAAPPSAVAIHKSEDALAALALMDYAPHRVAASIEGGIALSWRENDLDANIEFFNTGESLMEIPDPDGAPLIVDVDAIGLSAALERIRERMGG